MTNINTALPLYITDIVNQMNVLDSTKKHYLICTMNVYKYASTVFNISTNDIKRELITIDFLKGYYKHQLDKNYSRNTVASDIKAVSSILNLSAKRKDFINKGRYQPNDSDYIDIYSRASNLEHSLFENNDPREIASFILMRYYGMKASEVSSLLKDDIDFERKIITIRRKREKTNICIMDKHMEPFLTYNDIRNKKYPHNKYFIVARQKAPISVRYLELMLSHYSTLSPQKLRDLFAMELFKKTGSITTVSASLGITHGEAEKIIRYINNNGEITNTILLPE